MNNNSPLALSLSILICNQTCFHLNFPTGLPCHPVDTIYFKWENPLHNEDT